MRVVVAILGAGSSQRFGGDKLGELCAGKPLGCWALDSALATERPVVWIAGAETPSFVGDRCKVLHNPAPGAGLSTSVAIAARFARSSGYGALLIALADMPLVNERLLLRLLATGAPVACRHPDGRLGVPALFPASTFGALEMLAGDRGAGTLLAGLPNVGVVLSDHEELLDVDRTADLADADRLLCRRSKV